MNDRTTISPGDALNAATGELFRQAAGQGRNAFDAVECERFVASFGAALAEGVPGGVDLRIALENTREFGMVLTAGAGGLDGALDRANFRKDRAAVSAAVELTDAADFLRLFRRTVAYQKMAALAQRDGRRAPDPVLEFCFGLMLGLGREYSAQNPQAGFVIRELELDQVQFAKKPTVGAARVEFGKPVADRLPRPLHKIDKLIHPQSIGIIGVSASGMNFGRIILKNLMGSGYAKDKLTIIRPGETEIDGVRCVDSLRALPAKLDLLIVAVPNEAVYELVDEIIATDAVESVMLIPGGLGETAKSREPAAALAAKINAAHANPGGGPVFLGANCLGVVSHPGGYDSWFIPLERLPKPQKKAQRNSVMLSQSGAFMITRISQNPWLDPAYMLALGNQTDLTHGDMLSFFAERDGIDTLGIYIEGFKDGDGLDFVRAVRKAVLKGKQVVVYKSGRTEAGAGGVMGHTASIAGDPVLFEAVLRQAGAIVAEDFNTFDDLFYIAGSLHGKKVGKRLGAISGAGFEAVGMADSVATETSSLEMGALEAATVERVQAILASKRLDALVEVRNPIDINPGADDGVHLQITEAFLDDPNIDAVVVGLDPTAPSIRGLETSKLRPGYDLSDPQGTVHIYPPLAAKSDKPVIGIVDGGSLYDAMAAKLMDQGVCVFRNCGRGTKALAWYVEARLEADAIRERNK
ncbi:CoA-binding protein [Aromatoleum toluclasticum]|uniref:CoA-binding protein n=1 Tax=Aromatoleum toluclasticum TaxID=92003 RepID=UPI001D19689A|nr:CoA-binding protein [Aromatoleum toluclasticum]MCC4115936.1 CoA-binding protein [Aromatoleum toluclasticum]